MPKLAVIFPGIGYHRDKPLLYYAARLARQHGFAVMYTEYHGMPVKIRGNAEMMRQAAALACQQAAEQLANVAWEEQEKILLIGKSIGTVAAAETAKRCAPDAGQIWYTPLEATFSAAAARRCIAFLGEADPWSDVSAVQRIAAKQQIPLYLFPDCNHSLECADTLQNLDILRRVMQRTAQWIAEY